MAYSAVFSLSQILEKILKHDQYNNSFDHEKNPIETLYEKVIFLQEFLEEFPEKAKKLEGRMRDAANKTRDIIESEQIGSVQGYLDLGGMDYFLFLILQFHSCVFGRDPVDMLCHYLRKQRKEIDCIVEEVLKVKKLIDANEEDLSIHSYSAASYLLTKDIMVGLDDDLIEILDRLTGYQSRLETIPIVGMGGIGKTTLAKNAYENPFVIHHFDVHAWVTVSQDYRPREILQGLLRSIGASTAERFEERDDSLQERVYKRLKGKRYLIVMDDVWTTDAWDDVNRIFPDDNNGSRIVITTRLSEVAHYVNSSGDFHEMQLMNEDHSWTLLHETIFGKDTCPHELKIIGKTIARDCHGLPLAIVLMGGILSKVNRTEDAWRRIEKSVRSAIIWEDMPFKKVLSLSYDHLPQHLKACFLYLGSFSIDREIHVSKLIKLWVAEGFLKSSGSKSLEDVAQENLEDLVKRNLVLAIRKRVNGQTKTVRIHDLMRNLCLDKAHEDKFFHCVVDDDTHYFSQSIKNVHRISVLSGTLGHFSNINGPSIRTILFFKENRNLLRCLQSFILLNILNAEAIEFKEFPSEVVGLLHLKYLAFTYRGPSVKGGQLDLPAYFSKFQNLQTFIVRSRRTTSNDRIHLPFEICRMTELRHLVLFKKSFLPDFDGDLFVLINLQTLSHVANFTCSERVILMMPNLRKLGLYYSGDIFDIEWSKHHLHNLANLTRLEKLSFTVDWNSCKRQPLSRNLVAFPQSLKKLTLAGYRLLHWEDMTIIGSLLNLEILKLREYACYGDRWETNEGEFVRLKVLLIEKTDLCRWITESDHFPSLEHLVLCWCYNLEEIPICIGEIPTLQLVEMDNFKKSVTESAKYMEEEQQDMGNDYLQFRIHTPSSRFSGNNQKALR